MARRRVRLFMGELHYRPEIRLHTASSGDVPTLRELYLVLDEDGQRVACGAVRTNVEYLTGIPEMTVRDEAQHVLPLLPWDAQLEELRAIVEQQRDLSVTIRALIDTTLFDGLSRCAGVPLCVYLGGRFTGGYATNQSLFWGDDATLIDLARAYVARGFADLKLRVGVEDFERDLRRLARLRNELGDGVTLSVDVNGHWSEREAEERIERLTPLDLAYVEQPIPAGDWDAMARLARRSTIPLTLDESVASMGDVRELARRRIPAIAHVKLAKLGGVGPVVEAGRLLKAAGIELMVGQMNEGTVATAAAVHCAMALQPHRGELYGADGLLDDPANGLTYSSGAVEIGNGPGLGIAFHEQDAELLWEMTV
ncbi:mandelate racemase [bacterium]|nr:MAG: mandelate racemase [bacterium]